MPAVEWVEVQGPTVDTAIEAALAELGLDSAEDAEVEVIEEGRKGGFLGRGGQDAVVRVKRRETPRRGRRSRRGRGGGRPGQGSGGKGSGGSESQGRNSKPKGNRSSDRPASRPAREKPDRPRERKDDDDRQELPVEAQAEDIRGFLTGMLEAFGLDGDVEIRIEDGAIYADVVGEQTEALVGHKGSIVQATLELCRTIVQRKTVRGAKIRLDIAGYAARRRQALQIYTSRLAEKVKEDRGEVMLEPMNAADRKVVHDAVAEIDGVRSFSEGEEPRRSVVIAADE